MYRIVKRCFDCVFALVCMPFIAILTIFVGIAIKLDDGGSVFYRSKRVGKDCKVFDMMKFRSMKMNSADIRNADGSTFNSPTDARLTRVGKFLRKTSIDELPQLINVLKGDMSLIGPRPATPMILENMTELQSKRFAVRPGITGYTQMMYRNQAQGDMRYQADKYYVDNISFALDIKIIVGTAIKVLKRADVYNETSVRK